MDSNVENILRNMVDGTTEYDPPHSRVEKLLIELKETLDVGGGGGTVDDVARNRINTHIDNSNVHVSTAEKSSWNNKVERSDLTAHTEDTAIHVTNNDKATWNGKAEQKDLSEHADNGEIHVSADEKAAWNGKAELSDIPSTLPANGGNADTLDNKHASDFSQIINLGNTSTDTKTAIGIQYKTTTYWCSKWTDYPAESKDGQGMIIAVNYKGSGTTGTDNIWCRQIYITPHNSTIYQRIIVGTTVEEWISISDLGYHFDDRTQITSGDLNTITTQGQFVVTRATATNTLANQPWTTSGYYLDVYRRSTDIITQIALRWDGKIALRSLNGTTWRNWVNIADGGNADTLDGLHANEIASNPNLLTNPDFAVNQRGITSASGGTSTVYIADRWFSQRAIISRPENGGISIAWDGTNKDNGWIQQKIETAALFGKTVTISADIDGERKSVTTTIPTLVNKTDGGWVDSNKRVMFAVSNIGGRLMSIVIFSYTTTPIAISNVKLELGSMPTPYCPPDSAAELAKCQRYYQIRSTGDIAAVDMRPSMATIKDIKQRSDGNYEYIAEL